MMAERQITGRQVFKGVGPGFIDQGCRIICGGENSMFSRINLVVFIFIEENGATCQAGINRSVASAVIQIVHVELKVSDARWCCMVKGL